MQESIQVSLCMIVGNEEARILRCLNAFKDCFDELVLVRATGNKERDNTIELAKKFCEDSGKKFVAAEYINRDDHITWPHVDDFAAARNKSYSLASGKFLFWADADDVISTESAKLLREAMEKGDFDLMACNYDTKNGLRLLRDRASKKGFGRWERAIHEIITITEEEKNTGTSSIRKDIVFDHQPGGYKQESFERNMRIIDSRIEGLERDLFYKQQDLYLRGDHEKMIPIAKTALAFENLGDDEKYGIMCNLSLVSKTTKEKREWGLKAVALCPWRREALYNLTLVSMDMGRLLDAISFMRMYAHLPIPDPVPWNHLAAIYDYQGVKLAARVLRLTGNEKSATASEVSLFQSRGAKISLLHATRGRPVQCIDTMNEWLARADNEGAVEHIFGVDHDDAEVLKAIKQYRHVVCTPGGTTPQAYNEAAKVSAGRILIAMSDDAHPPAHWDTLIFRKMEESIEQEAVLAVSDGHRKDGLLCHQIMTRKRYEAQGHVFSEEYQSMYADNEFSHRAFKDGIVIDGREIVIEHRHPVFDGKGLETDATYAHTNHPDRYKKGLETFLRRNPECVIR